MRVLAYVRLSKLTETTTSPERQREAIADFIERKRWTLVDTVEDIDVSATRHRLDRPGIHEIRRRIKRGEAEAVVVHRLDRIARNVADVSTLLDEGIAIVSATEDFDTSTATGRAMTQVAQVFAELEARTIGLRVSSARKHLPTVGRWPGGPTPYGFTSAPSPDGVGRTLVHDPDEAPVVRRIVGEALRGDSLLSITRRLNADGIPPRRGADWSRSVVARLLRHGSIRGYATTGGAKASRPGEPQKPGDFVRDERGLPLIVWPPLVTPEEARELDRILKMGESAPKTIHDDTLLLVGLAVCSSCGRLMVARSSRRPTVDDPGRRWELYVCQTRNRGGLCDAPQTIRARLADEEAERQFLAAFGRVEVVETVEEAQEPEELADVVAAIEETTDAMRRPDADVMALAERLVTLRRERDRLQALPRTQAIHRRTGETYGDRWERATIPERREIMRGASAYVRIVPAIRRGAFTPDRVDLVDVLAGQLD
ncbi:recombinase family protein [Microbacterium sp.]|uniref:recombinase family protein n=1 Tax=Microbacterium sp. TaxID=51671 RepID=UPI0037CC6900